MVQYEKCHAHSIVQLEAMGQCIPPPRHVLNFGGDLDLDPDP